MRKLGDHDRENVRGPDSYYQGTLKVEAPKKLNIDIPGKHLPEYNDPRLCLKTATPEMILNEISYIRTYSTLISQVVQATKVTVEGKPRHLSLALDDMLTAFRSAHEKGYKVILVGNGGSSAICSHLAIDFCKNGGVRAISLNDFPSLTCLSNDFGYDEVFAKQIEYHARPGDCLVCISTGGKSRNILNAISAFKGMGGLETFTFTGMNPDNQLRTLGKTNFYSPSNDYGIVEIAHMTLLHSLCPCTA